MVRIGYVLLVVNQMLGLNPVKPVLNWRAAQWLPVYLIGLGLITYLSTFGPLSNPPLGDWSSLGVMAVFCLIIYYWAIAVALPKEEIERMINEVVAPEEEDVAHA